MNEFIDDRNKRLWDNLNESFEIEVRPSSNQEYGCYTINKSAILYVDYGNISKDSFTHELLHIYLKEKEFYLGSSIELTLRQSNILSRILSKPLIEHIGNCLDHLKMFKIYTELGFDERMFLLDFDVHKCNGSELANLKANFKTKRGVNAYAVDEFIGKSIAMLCDPNIKNDYSRQIAEFKKLDKGLFEVVERLVIETKEFNIESTDLFNSYRNISQNFYSGLIKWVHKNQIK